MAQQKTDQIVVDAFGHILQEQPKGLVCPEHKLAQFSVALDPTTGTAQPIITGYVDMDELIQSYAPSCGIEYALRLLRTGELSPDDLCDDGHHSGDGTMPTQLNVAFRQAQAAGATGAQIANTLGLGDVSKMSTDELTALVQQKIADALAKQTGAADTAKGE